MEMRDALMSPKCCKVIVMAHGTGATYLSHALDRLHADMPMELMAKMEMYTFGAAAKHMSNPCMTMDRSMTMGMNGMGMNGDKYMRADGSMKDSKMMGDKMGEGMMMRMEETERVIPVTHSLPTTFASQITQKHEELTRIKHMEHYMMSSDLMARCGIMHHSMILLDNRFCGRMFMVNRPGFMFTQYLDMMFPSTSSMRMGKRSGMSGMPMNGDGILNECPMVDVETCEKREFMANAMAGMKMMMGGMGMMGNMMGGMMKVMDMDSMMKDMKMNGIMGGKMMNGMGMMDGMRGDGMKEMMMDNGKGMKDQRRNSGMGCDGSVAMARMTAKDCEGKTVRRLSRLWRYAGGCKPSGEGVGMMNGVGLGVSGMDMSKMPNGMMMNGMNGSMDMGKMEMKGMDLKGIDMKGMDMKDMKMDGKTMKDMKKGMKSRGSMDMRNGAVAHGM
jgi:hypothetical protein